MSERGLFTNLFFTHSSIYHNKINKLAYTISGQFIHTNIERIFQITYTQHSFDNNISQNRTRENSDLIQLVLHIYCNKLRRVINYKGTQNQMGKII